VRERPTAAMRSASHLESLRIQQAYIARELAATPAFGPIHGHYRRELRRTIDAIADVHYFSVARRERQRRNVAS
jgi:hypothetical protein